MRLNVINQARTRPKRGAPAPGTDPGTELGRAMRFIYGRSGRPFGQARAQLHQTRLNAGVDAAAAQGGVGTGGRFLDPGTPWKPRYRRFFRMDNDGATIRYG